MSFRKGTKILRFTELHDTDIYEQQQEIKQRKNLVLNF